jgi:hypothetical protein
MVQEVCLFSRKGQENTGNSSPMASFPGCSPKNDSSDHSTTGQGALSPVFGIQSQPSEGLLGEKRDDFFRLKQYIIFFS